MEIVNNISEMRQHRSQLTTPIGFVPTMGYLHEGHLSLVREAHTGNKTVVVSIFVNPTQFGPGEDYKKYPRDIKRDLVLLEEEKTDIVFMPQDEELYPENFSSYVDAGEITTRLEGASRPGHFRGVVTILAKLFNIVQPDSAYFGQKDAQQLLVIRKMVADLNMHLEIIAVPTVRTPDGLAMSSRNTYLTTKQRRAATVLYRALTFSQYLWDGGENNSETIRQQMISLIKKESLADIDYVSIADVETLKEIDEINPPVLVSMAVKFGKTRLIDNIVLK
ncbi:pantoate--beta-alanine ligase [Chloroflexota bacterium]